MASKSERLAKKQQARLLREINKKRQNTKITEEEVYELLSLPSKSRKKRIEEISAENVRKNVSRETSLPTRKLKTQQEAQTKTKVATKKFAEARTKQLTKIRKSKVTPTAISLRTTKPKIKKSKEELHEIRSKASKKAYQTKIGKMTPQELKEYNRRQGERLQEAKKQKAYKKQVKEISDILNYDVDIFESGDEAIQNEDRFSVTYTVSQEDFSIIEAIRERFIEVEKESPIEYKVLGLRETRYINIAEFGLVSDFDDIVNEHEINGTLKNYISWLYEQQEALVGYIDDMLELKYPDIHYDMAIEHLQTIYSIIQGGAMDMAQAVEIGERQDSINGF